MSQSISAPTRSAPPAAPNAQGQSQLNQLVRKYRSDVSSNASADVLATLARQINSAARALGTQVTLPKATGGGGAPSGRAATAAPPAAASQGAATGNQGAATVKVSVTA